VLVLTLRPGQSLDVGRIRFNLLQGGWHPHVSLDSGQSVLTTRMVRGVSLEQHGITFKLLRGGRNQCRIGITAPQYVKIGKPYAISAETVGVQGVL
jgi:sRNA-binding carbon storage regulator CsrA